MLRRYAPDGTPLINGKMPEELTDNDMRQFLADTKKQLNSLQIKSQALFKKKLKK